MKFLRDMSDVVIGGGTGLVVSVVLILFVIIPGMITGEYVGEEC